jgi:hypothetical protein
MLTFEDAAILILIEQHRRALNANHFINGWGCGPIVDNFAGLQGAFFRLLGRQDRTPGNYPRDPGDSAIGATNEYIHPTARIRKGKVSNWNPPSLKGYALEEPDGSGAGWKWVKRGVQVVPEYVMRPERTMSIAYKEADGRVRYDVKNSLARLLCPKNILLELDEANRLIVKE